MAPPPPPPLSNLTAAAQPAPAELAAQVKRVLRKETRARAWRMRSFYGLLLMAFALLVVFKYAPIWGVSISFLDFNFYDGILGSAWNDFAHFRRLFREPFFLRVFRNNVILSLLHLAITFPAPIVLALLLNEVRHTIYKRVVQSIGYLPHFMSWVVLAGILREFLSPSTGFAGWAFTQLGLDPVNWFANVETFRALLVGTAIWQSVGWGSILYLAALSGIDPQLYEAGAIDGSSRWQNAIHITLPSLVPVITILFLLRLGNFFEQSFEHVFMMYNEGVYEVGDIMETYIYRGGIQSGDHDYNTAVGLFQNVLGLALLIIVNQITRRYNDFSVW